MSDDLKADSPAGHCYCCGLDGHRYMFGFDGGPADADKHEPTAVACANMVLHAIDRMLAKEDPDAAKYVRQEVDTAITKMGYYIDQLARNGSETKAQVDELG